MSVRSSTNPRPDRADGYVTDIVYTHHYAAEINPIQQSLLFLSAGLLPPSPTRIACELGFGQGLSLNIHAAASLTHWWGTDVNPDHGASARRLSTASGATTTLLDESFAELRDRADLPEFDFIACHGVWSWISDENRSVIVEILDRKLKPGGVLYLSYYTLPGWASMLPMRRLLNEHANRLAAPEDGSAARIKAALGFVERLAETHPAYLREHPRVMERLRGIKDMSPRYLAHEYLGHDWHPMLFTDTARWLRPAGLDFAASARFLDQVAAFNLTLEQSQLLAEIPDQTFRETVRDFMTGQTMRSEYWVKGLRPIGQAERAERLRDERLVLVHQRSAVPLEIRLDIGKANLDQAIYGPILDCLADHRPRTIGAIERAVAPHSIHFDQILMATRVLLATGVIAPAQPDPIIAQVRDQTSRLNACLIDEARSSGEIGFLASPVTGGGIPVSRFGQLFLLSDSRGRHTPEEWAADAWDILSAQGGRMVKNAQPLTTEEESRDELLRLARELSGTKAMLSALGITATEGPSAT